MSEQHPSLVFDEAMAETYDQRFTKLAPMRDALHLICGVILEGLPENARILCVGAGTGAEILYLGQKFPGWRFTAVEPAGPMLNVCRRRLEEHGLLSRCELHEGYLDSLPAAEAFDGATSLLVSHFILSIDDRRQYFREIARRLKPGGILVTADLAADQSSREYAELLDVWTRVIRTPEMTAEQIEGLRETFKRDVAFLPLDTWNELIRSAGFEMPVPFLQTCLIRASFARRTV